MIMNERHKDDQLLDKRRISCGEADIRMHLHRIISRDTKTPSKINFSRLLELKLDAYLKIYRIDF